MRIKKKDIILEASLLDVSPDFTPTERRLIRVLEKKYGTGGTSSDFDRFDAAAWLIENMNIPYDQAYDLTLTYWWHGDELFKEYKPTRKKENRGYIFYRMMNKLINKYIESRGESIADVEVTWEDPQHWFGEEEAFVALSEVTLWDGHRGFTLYIPLPGTYVDRFSVPYQVRNSATLMVYVTLDEYPDRESEEKSNKYVNLKISYKADDTSSNKNRTPLVDKDIKIPESLTEENIYKIFTDVIKLTLEKIEEQVFLVPHYEEEEKPTDSNSILQ